MKTTWILSLCMGLFASAATQAQNERKTPKAFLDYTARGKVRMAAAAGEFSEGLVVFPRADPEFDVLRPASTSEIDAKINWRLSADTLEKLPAGSIVCFDVPAADRTWNPKLVFKDLSRPGLLAMEAKIDQKLTKGGKEFFVIYSDTPNKGLELLPCSSTADLRRHWARITDSVGSYRYIMAENMIWVSKVRPDAESSRIEMIKRYVDDCQPLLAGMKGSQHPALASSLFSQKTDALFDSLKSQGAMDDKATAYELRWRIDRSRLSDATGEKVLSAREIFKTILSQQR